MLPNYVRVLRTFIFIFFIFQFTIHVSWQEWPLWCRHMVDSWDMFMSKGMNPPIQDVHSVLETLPSYHTGHVVESMWWVKLIMLDLNRKMPINIVRVPSWLILVPQRVTNIWRYKIWSFLIEYSEICDSFMETTLFIRLNILFFVLSYLSERQPIFNSFDSLQQKYVNQPGPRSDIHVHTTERWTHSTHAYIGQ